MITMDVDRTWLVRCDTTGCDRRTYMVGETEGAAGQRAVKVLGWRYEDGGTVLCRVCAQVEAAHGA